MPVALTERDLEQADRSSTPPRKRWTRAEVEELEKLSSFADQKWELIEGDLVNKMGKNWRHTNVAWRLVKSLCAIFGIDRVQHERPIDVAHADNLTSQPEPDVVVLAKDFSSYRGNPRPADLHLVLEVADSSLGQDLRTKAALYARAGIIEYWVADIQANRLIVHRDPDPIAGIYRSVQVYLDGETVAPLAATEHTVSISDIFA